jgi:phosphohistidine swiveling domain-containing protein
MAGTETAPERTWVRRLGPLGHLETDWQRHYCINAVECYEETATFVQEYDDFRVDDGWLYVRVPDETPEQKQARRDAYNEQALVHLDHGTDHWEAVSKPETVSRLTAMRRARPRTEAIPPLVRHVEVCMEHASRILGNLHWAMVGGFVADNDGKFAEVAGCAKEEVPRFVGGHSHATDRLVRRLRTLARMQRDGDPAFEAAFARLLRDHGRRNGSGYGSATTFASPTWAMEPAIALDVISGYARSDIDAAERRERALNRKRRESYRRLRSKIEAEDDQRALALDRAHDVIARQIRAMEDHNALMEQEAQGTLRESIDRLGRALVAAGRVDKPTDVLSLSLDELRDLPSGDLRDLVGERKEQRRARLSDPPPPFLGPEPAGPTGIDIGSTTDEVPLDPNVLVGVAGSAGRATGRAVVATDTHLPPDIEPGDILIARDAGPAWTPIFPLLAAVVLDHGAAFQHAALVAREYGIPAVLGTKTATADIAAGSIITVDGSAGRVMLRA